MLENYLNKEVIIEEKLYSGPSTLYSNRMAGVSYQNKTEGIITAIDDEFVELDNKMLIAKKFIYRVVLK